MLFLGAKLHILLYVLQSIRRRSRLLFQQEFQHEFRPKKLNFVIFQLCRSEKQTVSEFRKQLHASQQEQHAIYKLRHLFAYSFVTDFIHDWIGRKYIICLGKTYLVEFVNTIYFEARSTKCIYYITPFSSILFPFINLEKKLTK